MPKQAKNLIALIIKRYDYFGIFEMCQSGRFGEMRVLNILLACIVSYFYDLILKCSRLNNLYLVAVAQNPLFNLIETIDTELNDDGTIRLISNCLRTVPLNLRDVMSEVGQKSEFDIIDSTFQIH